MYDVTAAYTTGDAGSGEAADGRQPIGTSTFVCATTFPPISFSFTHVSFSRFPSPEPVAGPEDPARARALGIRSRECRVTLYGRIPRAEGKTRNFIPLHSARWTCRSSPKEKKWYSLASNFRYAVVGRQLSRL